MEKDEKEIIKDIEETNLILLCREFNRENGEVSVYNAGIIQLKDLHITTLQLRQRYNPNLKYFTMFKMPYNDEAQVEYVMGLIKKEIKSDLYTYI